MIRLDHLLPAALILLFAVVACDRKRQAPETPEATSASAAETDSSERTDDTPARIVSLAPSVTETLYALGAGGRVVGVTRFCDYPPEVREKPKVGGLTDTDVEAIVSLEPDLVIGVANQTSRPLQRTLRKAEVPTLFVPVETFEQVTAAIAEIGRRVGAEERARELNEEILAVHRPPDPKSPAVMVLFGREPWIAAGPGTFADEMIRRGGGRNALAEATKAYVTMDTERMRATDADLVIDTTFGTDAAEPPVPGARTVRIDPALIRPGPRLAVAMKRFAEEIEKARSEERP